MNSKMAGSYTALPRERGARPDSNGSIEESFGVLDAQLAGHQLGE